MKIHSKNEISELLSHETKKLVKKSKSTRTACDWGGDMHTTQVNMKPECTKKFQVH